MHQQIRTSPDSTAENIRRVVDVLAASGVNVDGIGPDFEAPHVRTVVSHEDLDTALGALRRAGLEPELRPAVTFSLSDAPGQLAASLEKLAGHGYGIESVLVLAGGDSGPGQALVSIGVRLPMPDDWEKTAAELSGHR